MSRDGFQGGTEKWDLSLTSISRALSLITIPFFAYSIGLLPTVISFIYILKFLNLSRPLHIFILPFILIFEFLLFIVFESFIPALFIRAMHLSVEEGEHDISIKDKGFFKYSLYFILYRPALKILTFLPMIPLRTRFYRLVGLKFGKTTLFAGSELIHDPYSVEIGEQTLIGGWSQITGHVGERKLIVKKVKIGDNCLVGGKSFIFPGVVVEDDVTIALGSVVPKNMVLKKGRIYGGVPVKEIGINKSKKK